MKIYLGRHGETDLNEDERERGWSQEPLNEHGRAEAAKDGDKARGKGIEIIISSDLQRAKQTAQIIGAMLGVETQVLPQLRTWNLGDFTGRLCSEVEPKVRDYIRSRPDDPVPGGESFNVFKERIFAGLVQAVQRAGPRTVLLVVHSRIERVIEGWVAAGQPADHRLDIKTVLEKSEPPGGLEQVKLNVAALGGYSTGADSMLAAAKRVPDERMGSAFRLMRGGGMVR